MREGPTGWKFLWEVTLGKSRQEEVTQTTQGPEEDTTGRGFTHGKLAALLGLLVCIVANSS